MKKVVTFGEIMLRLAPPGFLRFSQTNTFDIVYGGGESNVAISLANYGVPVRFVTRIPENDIGQSAKMEMRKRGVETEFMIYGGDRLGIYFLETGAVSRGSKVIYDRANSAMSEIQIGMIDWDEAFDGVEWFHWTGITPAISQSAADACLEAVKIAHEKGITISTDLNYRAKLWKYCDNTQRENIMTELTSYSDIILGNEEDAEMHFDIKPEGLTVQIEGKEVKAEAFLSVCKQMMKKFPKAKKVITTLRGFSRLRDGQIHTDSKSKILTVLLYLNPQWDNKVGNLRLLKENSNLEDYITEISSGFGNLVAFKVTENCWHGFEPFEGRRLSIQLNYIYPESLKSHRFRHMISSKLKKFISSKKS